MLNDQANDELNNSNSPKGERKTSPDGMNDISIINQTANTNMSMNTTSLDFLNKLHSKQSIIATQSKAQIQEQKPINLDHFDT